MTNDQQSFRKNFSTTAQLLHVAHIASKAVNEKSRFHLVSFDFSKAFDVVLHNLLIYKLRKYCFDDCVVRWIEEWLRDRASVVKVNGQTSSRFVVGSGVPQGSVLGPLLFLIYINDLPDCTTGAECRLYADDTLLCMGLDGVGPGALQENVSSLSEWADYWGMRFNPSKCMHMGVGKDLPEFELILDSTSLPKTSQVKYLGVTLDSSLRWNVHITGVIRKANKVLGLLRRSLGNTSSKTCMLSFNTVVRPTLEYASQVWSPHNQNLMQALDMVQRRAVRWAFRLNRMDSVTETMLKHNIISLSERRDVLDLAYLAKVECGLYDIELSDYISFNKEHNTRHGTINPHYTVNVFKYSFYNRMREFVKLRHY
jgi:hypothetical protein